MLTNPHGLNNLSRTIIGCSYEVANVLGRGFVEKVYANALAMEIQSKNIAVKTEYPIRVYYKDMVVGDFFADLLVGNSILVETKANSSLTNLHMSQCLNYLKATRFPVCLLINFGCESVQIRRILNDF